MISSLTKRYPSLVVLCALLAATCILHRPAVAPAQQPAQQPVVEQPDKYTWLEDIYGEKQLAWVKTEIGRASCRERV